MSEISPRDIYAIGTSRGALVPPGHIAGSPPGPVVSTEVSREHPPLQWLQGLALVLLMYYLYRVLVLRTGYIPRYLLLSTAGKPR